MSTAFLRVLAVSAALKIAFALVFADLTPRYDETEYLEFGRHIVERGDLPVLWRAPGYQAFVAAGLGLAGGRPLGVRLLQVIVSLAATVLVHRIARVRWGERCAFRAGTFVAFFPSDIAFSHLLWSEALYGTLVLAAFERLLVSREHGEFKAAALAGLFLGAATLTRSTGAILAAASIAWCLAGGTARLKRAAAVALAWAAFVGPWSVHASGRAGRFVLVDTNSGFNLWSGNNEMIPRDAGSLWCVGLPLENGGMPPGPLGSFLPGGNWREKVRLEMQREGIDDPEGPGGDLWYRREAAAAIRGDPAGFASRLPKKLAAFWAPDFFLPRHVVRDWYGAISPQLAVAVVALTWISCAVPLIAGPAALAVLRASAFRSLAILWIVATAALHAIAYGHSRMHAPLTPVLILAVFGAMIEAPSHSRWLRRGIPWALFALVLWILAMPLVAGLYLGPSARHAGFAQALGVLRKTPLPGARWVAWMESGVLETKGRYDEAERILRENAWTDDAWSIFLRGRLAMTRVSEDPDAPSPEAWAAALPDLQLAYSRDRGSDPIALALLYAMRECGREEEAAKLLEEIQALRARPEP